MDPIVDLIIQIKNGYRAGKSEVSIPYSKFKEEVIKKLVELKYLEKYSIEGEVAKKFDITLLYNDTVPAITDVKLYSRPGRRWYTGSRDLRSVLGGMGYSLLSTSQGVLTQVEAKRKKLGGELLFSIW